MASASARRRACRLWIPRPKSFLGIAALETGTEMITLALLFNRATGLYGLLAILTGYALSAAQLSMYIYSAVVLVLLAYLIGHIRRQSPLQCLALAWLYLVDTLVNAAYTSVFMSRWYAADRAQSAAVRGDDAAVSAREPQPVHESALSMVLIVSVTVLRVYLVLVIMAFASTVLRQSAFAAVAAASAAGLDKEEDGEDGEDGEVGEKAAVLGSNPFSPHLRFGKGWKGRLGRALVAPGRAYWLGDLDDDEWARDTSERLQARGSGRQDDAAVAV